jgi:PPOX class probable F420-dependent enzyme
MASLSEAQKSFIKNPYYAVITTLRADGSPHSTVVWVDIDGDDLVFNTAVGRAKEVHLKANPRVSVAIVDPANPYQWVAISGSAKLESDGAVEMIDRLSNKYQGKDYPREWMAPGEVRVTGRITPDKVDAYGFDAA